MQLSRVNGTRSRRGWGCGPCRPMEINVGLRNLFMRMWISEMLQGQTVCFLKYKVILLISCHIHVRWTRHLIVIAIRLIAMLNIVLSEHFVWRIFTTVIVGLDIPNCNGVAPIIMGSAGEGSHHLAHRYREISVVGVQDFTSDRNKNKFRITGVVHL